MTSPALPTFVTSFYDLQSREQNSVRKSADEYFGHGKFVMSINAPMVIFTEPKYVKRVREMRSKMLAKTFIWIYMPEQFRYFDRLNLVTECRNKNPIRNSDPRKDTALYTILMWEKFNMLQLAIDLNLFDTSHYAWIDFGIAHVASTKWSTNMHTWAPDKIKLSVMKYGSDNEVQDFSLRYGFVPGGFWIGPKDMIVQLNQVAFSTLDTGLINGWAIMDEQLLAYLAHKNPQMFEHYFSDYGGMLDNFNEIHRDSYTILANVRHCTARKDHKKAFDMCTSLWQSYASGHLTMNYEELSTLLYEYYIVSFYTQPVEHAKMIKNIYMNMTLVPGFNAYYLRNKQSVDNNFSFVS